MARKIIKEGVKAGVQKIGRGLRSGKAKIDPVKDLKAAKAATAAAKKTKTVKRSEAPIQSERSKITAANKTAANQRAKAAAKTAGVSATRNTTNKVLPVGSKRATALGLGASAAAIGTLNKKKPAAKKETFAQAFKKARAKGEGTKFTHDGKKYTAVTKTDLKKKGFDANELAAYNKRGGKARGPLNRLGQKAKKVLLGKDKKFGGDKGAIDFIRKPKKKADGGIMSRQPMPTMRRRPPTPPMPPRSRVPKTRTQLIDPKLPKGKVGKGPLEPSDSTTRVPSQRKGIRKGLAGMLKKTMKAQAMNPPKLKKGPGMKDGGVAKKVGGGMMYKKNGGAVGSSKKGGGMAIRGLGKAFKNSKR